MFLDMQGDAVFLQWGDNPRVGGHSFDDAFVALGLPYDAETYKPTFRKLVDGIYGNVAGTRVVGAAAAEMCYVACGRFDGRVEAFLGPWDIAAGILIVKNAGGRTTDFRGGNDYESGRQIVASNGKIHDFLLKMLEEE